MKQEYPRKLSEIKVTEGIVPFLLAIFRGADINEQVKRERVRKKPFVQEYFDRISRAGNLAVPLMQTDIKRYKALVLFGADTRKIIENSYDVDVKYLHKHLMLYEPLLQNKSAQEAIKSNGWRLMQLKGLQQCLDRVSRVITASGLVEGMGEVPEPWDLQAEQNRQIAEAASIEGLSTTNEDFEHMIEHMKEQNERLERGEPLEEDNPFGLFG